MASYPVSFRPIFKERIWGGRRLHSLYGKALPPGQMIGESWEICDRPGDCSVIANGPWAGKDLRWLMTHHGRDLLGRSVDSDERFPLLVKVLDAEEDLSLQVHPPEQIAASLAGEPKTEFWYVAEARPGACLHAGLKSGVTRDSFAQQAREGTVAQAFHRHSLQSGDAMFLPSGRVHALGAGTVVFEVQQNSDTTYRVFDWNRLGLDGRPRELHLDQALNAIAFDDFEPDLIRSEWVQSPQGGMERELVSHRLFRITQFRWEAGESRTFRPNGQMSIWAGLSGRLLLAGGNCELSLGPGDIGLSLANAADFSVRATGPAAAFRVEHPGNV